MRMLSITELMRLNRRELLEIEAEFTAALSGLAEGNRERSIALMNLQNIRFALYRPTIAP